MGLATKVLVTALGLAAVTVHGTDQVALPLVAESVWLWLVLLVTCANRVPLASVVPPLGERAVAAPLALRPMAAPAIGLP